MECASFKTACVYLGLIVIALLHLGQSLPIHVQDSAAAGNDVTVEDPCEGLPCDQWVEVQRKLAFLSALEAKDTDTLMDSYNEGVHSADPAEEDEEGPDILFTPDQIEEVLETAVKGHRENHREKRKVIKQDSYRWDMPVHYVINGTFQTYQKDVIRGALKQWTDNTCVSFVEVDKDDDAPNFKHLVFKSKSSGCASYVGNVNLGKTMAQPLYLATSCFGKFGVPVHEIGHALGLWHEHQRPIREGHIKILEENVVSYWLSNFQQKDNKRVENFDVPFDYNSVMHYGGRIGTKNGQYTIRTDDPLYQGNIGQRVGLSFLDAKAINLAYCQGECNADELRRPCQHGGYQDPKDCDRCRCPPGLTGRYCEDLEESVGAQCGDSISLNSGEEITVKSPGYDDKDRYDNFLECNWMFKAPSGSHVEIDFEDEFSIYSSHSGICMHWLEIKHNEDFAKPGPRFCGKNLPTAVLKSEGQEVLMTFRSNFAVNDDKTRGFSVKVKAVSDREEVATRKPTTRTTTATTTTTTTTTPKPTTTTEPTTTTKPTTTTTRPTTTTTEPATTTTEDNSSSEKWGEWSKCVGASLNCGCGGCGVRTRDRLCDGNKCGQQTETCSRVCVRKQDTYSYYIGKFYTKDCPECCPGFHKVGDVCKKN